MDVAFFGVENGHTFVAQFGYAVDPDGKPVPFMEPVEQGAGGQAVSIHKLGQSAAIIRHMRTSTDWVRLPGIDLAKSLVKIEADDVPGLVGGRISVLSVSPQRDEWVERGACTQDGTDNKK